MSADQTPPQKATPSSSKLEHAYESIRRRILDGTYSSGYRLVLDEIARELGISAVPVREAVRRLEAQGYVEFKRHIGARVASVEDAEFTQTLHVLALLEGYATALALPTISRAELREARRLNDRMGASLRHVDSFEFASLNQRFHALLYAGCPNQHVLQLLDQQWARLGVRRSVFMYVPERARKSVEEHQALLDLIEGKAGADKIEQASRDHKLRTAAVVEREHRNAAGVGRA